MKQAIFHQIFGIAAFLLLLGNVQAQMLVNKEWERLIGIPDTTVNWSATHIDPSGNVTIAGNTIIALGQTALLVTKYDKHGIQIWQQTYQHNGNVKNYATAITGDVNGNLFVTGATSGANLLFDFLTLQLDISGNVIWASTYDGNSNLYDIPLAITLDISGNVIVTGSSFDVSSQSDYATVKYDANGTELWGATYDYTGLHDAAIGVKTDANENVIVTGASASTNNNYDYFTLEYDKYGSQTNMNRQNVAGQGLDNPLSMERDASGNIYITGKVQSGNNIDIRTIKLNAGFVFQWAKTYDNVGLEDVGQSICIDGSGNVILTGYTTNTAGDRDVIIIKYNSNGAAIWTKTYSAEGIQNAEGKDIAVDNQGNIYVTGDIENGNNTDFINLCYNSNGGIEWYNMYGNSGMDAAIDIKTAAGGSVYITGKYNNNGTDKYLLSKFTLHKSPQSVVYDTIGKPLYMKDELIIRFDSSALYTQKFQTIDNVFGKAGDFIHPDVIDSMEIKLGISNLEEAIVSKIHKRLTIFDTISISRLGDTVRMPNFWATLLLELPQQRSISSEPEMADSLMNLVVIAYAEPNFIVESDFVPDDFLYNGVAQAGLHPVFTPTDFSDADINMEEAWDYARGNPNIKVGVVGHRIYWRHEDFNKVNTSGVEASSMAESKVSDGFSFIFNAPLGTLLPTSRHETQCAGVIGALSNNNLGVAGIAGGDMSNPNPSLRNSGCTLISLEVFDDAHQTIAQCAAAIIEGASSSGFGVHILNNSWGDENGARSLWEAVEFAYQNNVLVVASRGNLGVDIPRFPATYTPDRVLCVGGCGINGERLTNSNTSPGTNCPSNFGSGMDVIAPATSDLIRTTAFSSINTSAYWKFGCTSGAAPHASGLAALMMGYIDDLGNSAPNHLAPEDVDNIIQATAQDKNVSNNPPNTTYDDQTGWGLIDAGAAMKAIQFPQYIIKHFNQNNATVTAHTQIANHVIFDNNHNITYNNQLLPKGKYKVDVWQVDFQINFGQTLSPGQVVLDGWALNSNSNGWRDFIGGNNAPFSLPSEPLTQVDWGTPNWNTGVVNGTTFFYDFKLKKQLVWWNPFNVSFPTNHNSAKVAISLYLKDNSVTTIDEVKEPEKIFAYPNPANQVITIQYDCGESRDAKLQIFDVLGRLVAEKDNLPTLLGTNNVSQSVSDLSNGVYAIKITTGKETLTSKIIINH